MADWTDQTYRQLNNVSCVRRFPYAPRLSIPRSYSPDFPQFAFQNLARPVLRQLRNQMDLARHLVPAEVVAAVLAHLLRGRLRALLKCDEATGISPCSSSGSPTTAASRTAGCW